MNRICVLIILSVFILTGCVDQIEFGDNQNLDELVVSGVFTNKDEVQKINLSYTLDIKSQIPRPLSGAKLGVESENGERIEFFEQTEGQYLGLGFAKKGERYRMYATLPDGRNIKSNFQSVPDSFPIIDIQTVDTLFTFVNGSGQNVRQRTLEFYAEAGANIIDHDFYLRYQPSTVYQVLETVCSPFHTVKRCFIYDDQAPEEVDLIILNEQASPARIQSKVYSRRIDYQFAEVFALDLALYSYNKSEFEYWERLKLLFDQSGNITDAQPARLTGNITADDGSEILGQFAVVGKSRAIKLVRNDGFSPSVLPFCGYAGNRPWPLPDECCNCLGLEGAVTVKPDYWP